MKKRVLLTAVFFLSLTPMVLNQYGGARGVQEINGLINLLNPIGIASVIVYLVGVWSHFQKRSAGILLGLAGTLGMVASEVYQFFNWYVMTITGESTLAYSIRFAFPEFYVGLAVSVLMVAAFLMLSWKLPENEQNM